MNTKPRLSIGSDHGGVELKKFLTDSLLKEGYEVADEGTYTTDSCHYPTFAFAVANKVKNKEADLGIVICTTGEGVSMAANKVKGIRCGVCYNQEVARLMKEHNDANVISFGAKYISKEEALECLHIFLTSHFLQGRHEIRVDMIKEYEDLHFKD